MNESTHSRYASFRRRSCRLSKQKVQTATLWCFTTWTIGQVWNCTVSSLLLIPALQEVFVYFCFNWIGTFLVKSVSSTSSSRPSLLSAAVIYASNKQQSTVFTQELSSLTAHWLNLLQPFGICCINKQKMSVFPTLADTSVPDKSLVTNPSWRKKNQ